MSCKKQVIADLLFGVQIVGALVFCGSYFVRSLHDVTGSSVVQFCFVVAFLFFCLTLSIGAYRAKPDRPTKQGIVTYIVWLIMLIAVIAATMGNEGYKWNNKEVAILVWGLVLAGIVIIIGITLKTKVTDPMMRGLLAITFKSIPQILLAWKFIEEGASGTPAVAIIVGHVTILIRLSQIYFMVRESGWDKNRKWLAVSEVSNEASWIITSVVWVFVY